MPRMRDAALAARIKSLRSQLGMTQEELAQRIGVTRNAVARWEMPGGEGRAPGAAVLRKLADALECPITDLLSG